MEQMRRGFLMILLFHSIGFSLGQDTDVIAWLLMDKHISNLDSLSNNSDVYGIMKSLLSSKGDTRMSKYGCYTNVEQGRIAFYSQSVRHPTATKLTKQFVALYLINALFYKEFEFVDQRVITFQNRKGNLKYFTNTKQPKIPPKTTNPLLYPPYPYKNKVCRNLYKIYSAWLDKVEEMGLDKAREINFAPLNGSIYTWGVGKTSK